MKHDHVQNPQIVSGMWVYAGFEVRDTEKKRNLMIAENHSDACLLQHSCRR